MARMFSIVPLRRILVGDSPLRPNVLLASNRYAISWCGSSAPTSPTFAARPDTGRMAAGSNWSSLARMGRPRSSGMRASRTSPPAGSDLKPTCNVTGGPGHARATSSLPIQTVTFPRVNISERRAPLLRPAVLAPSDRPTRRGTRPRAPCRLPASPGRRSRRRCRPSRAGHPR